MGLLIFFFLFPTVLFAKNPLSEGFLLLEKKEYAKAFQTFSSIKPKKPHIYSAMGMAKAMNGDYERALDLLLLATEDKNEKNNWVTNFFIGLSFYNLLKYQEAIPFLERSYELNNDSKILELIGKSYFKIENYNKAEEVLEKLYKEKKDEENILLLIKSKISLNKYSDAEKILNETLSLYPKNAHLIYERAKLRFKMGQIEEAERDMEYAIKLNKSTEIKNFYSSIVISKKNKTQKTNIGETINISLLLSGIVFLSLAGILLFFYRKKEKLIEEQLTFAKILLGKSDFLYANNIFLELMKYKKYRDSSLKGIIITKILLNQIDDAILWAEKIKDEKEKFFYLSLISLYKDDKESFNKYYNFLEELGDQRILETLKILSYSPKEKIIDFLIKEIL